MRRLLVENDPEVSKAPPKRRRADHHLRVAQGRRSVKALAAPGPEYNRPHGNNMAANDRGPNC